MTFILNLYCTEKNRDTHQMSVVAIGSANSSTTMYEENYPVISAGNALVSLGDAPLAPNASLDYQLIPPRDYGGTPSQLVDYLIDITIVYTVVVPPGETDESGLVELVAGDLDANDYDRDIVQQTILFYTSADTYSVKSHLCGIVRIQKDQPVDIRITRDGGNPAVTWTLNGAYRKFKRLE